jgi:hypothetical protein
MALVAGEHRIGVVGAAVVDDQQFPADPVRDHELAQRGQRLVEESGAVGIQIATVISGMSRLGG